MLRTSTKPPATAGAASTSLDTRARQRTAPLAGSSATTSPSSLTTATVRSSAPTPPESLSRRSSRQRVSPLTASSRVTVPSRAAAYSASPTSAGEKVKFSAEPTLCDQSTRTGCGFSRYTSAAGSGPEGPEQAAARSAAHIHRAVFISSTP
jgi:hypothetical protein